MVWQRPFFSGVLFLLTLFFTILYESFFSICYNNFDFMILFYSWYGWVSYRMVSHCMVYWILWYTTILCIILWKFLVYTWFSHYCDDDLSLLIFRHCYHYWYSWFIFMRVYISFYNTSPLHSTTKNCYFLRLVNIFFFVCLTFFLGK